jgi:hypothetical protein
LRVVEVVVDRLRVAVVVLVAFDIPRRLPSHRIRNTPSSSVQAAQAVERVQMERPETHRSSAPFPARVEAAAVVTDSLRPTGKMEDRVEEAAVHSR